MRLDYTDIPAICTASSRHRVFEACTLGVVIDADRFFGTGSPFNEALPGFVAREGQALMASVVGEAIEDRDILVVEAGTGTGKTFAYLLPALLSGRKTIISTGTKALQDQLYHRDLPLVARVAGRPVTTALLKGRANYLCLHRLEQVSEPAAALADDLAAIHEWRHRTDTGDRAELAAVAEHAPVWPAVTSTADNCLGQKCGFYNDCHVVNARRAAQAADLLVVNHHLLLADLAMKEQGFVEFLPGADTVVLDEAHQIPDLAVQFFGVSLGSRELERLLGEIRVRVMPFAAVELNRRVDALETAVRVLKAAAPREARRHELDAVMPGLREPLGGLLEAIADLVDGLDSVAAAEDAVQALLERLAACGERLKILVDETSPDGLRWLEVKPQSIRLNLTPLDVSAKLSGLMNSDSQAWIFTSATLAIGDDFSHFTSRLGIGDARCLRFESPFELDRNALIWLPPGLPEPKDRRHTETLLACVAPLFDEIDGGVFFLFTSYRALNLARAWFGARRPALRSRRLLVQGTAPRDDLTRSFREAGNAVLLGTGSFWQGVDVRGEALTLVVIDKLPFASPTDPLTMARLEHIRRVGGNAFMEHQVPQAVLTLKQGAGRLLRSENDYGVIVIGDSRVGVKPYGRRFLDALAPVPTTGDIEDVAAFFRARRRAVA